MTSLLFNYIIIHHHHWFITLIKFSFLKYIQKNIIKSNQIKYIYILLLLNFWKRQGHETGHERHSTFHFNMSFVRHEKRLKNNSGFYSTERSSFFIGKIQWTLCLYFKLVRCQRIGFKLRKFEILNWWIILKTDNKCSNIKNPLRSVEDVVL